MNDAEAGLTWDEVKARLPMRTAVEGVVTAVPAYGVWFDLGVGFPGLMLIPETGLERGQRLDERYQPGQKATAYVLWHNDGKHQIWLTLNQKFVTEQR
jgi:small subunit ribosomal protein S1